MHPDKNYKTKPAEIDRDKVYWIWQDGEQVQISYDTYTQQWVAIVNNSGRAW